MKLSKLGFTLIELMIVVVVIGILAAIAIPKFAEISKRGKEAEAAPILKQLYTLQERHVQRTGGYATNLTDLEGGTANYSGSFYAFHLTADPGGTTYVACGAPTDPAWGIRSFQIDQAGAISEGTC